MGKGEIIKHGANVAILSFGTLLPAAIEAAEILGATVANMRFVKPLDQNLIRELEKSHDLIVTLEENTIAGGAGSAVNEFLSEQQLSTPTLNLGIPDRYIEHASQQSQLAECRLDTQGIIDSINESIYYQTIEVKQSKSL